MRYRDILDAEVPGRNAASIAGHPRMSIEKRAAQFLPFSALSGFGDVIEEAGGTEVSKRLLAEEAKEELDRVLAQLLEKPAGERTARLTFYVKGERGGHYEGRDVRIRSVDRTGGCLVLEGGERIGLDSIADLSPAGAEAER